MMQSLIDPALLLGGDASIDYVFRISSLVLYEQGGIKKSSSILPPSPRMVSFDWNSIINPPLPFYSPFQIMVKVISTRIFHSILDEGASISILSS